MISVQEPYYELETQSILPQSGNRFTIPFYEIYNAGKNEFLIIEKYMKKIRCNYTQRQILELMFLLPVFFLFSAIYKIRSWCFLICFFIEQYCGHFLM